MKSSRHPRPPIESLSDLIYGLSLSIGAISLVITNGQASRTTDINLNILEFLSVFLILITSWIIYTGDMSVLPVETRLVTFLNIVLLMLVAIIPYLFDQVVSNSNPSPVQDYASVLFTADHALTIMIMAVFAHIIAQEEKQLIDGEIMIRFRRSRNILFILSGIVLVSLAAPWNLLFLQVHVRILIWFAPIIMFWFNRMRAWPSGIPSTSPHTA
jgi:hypothetical protein